MKIYTILFIAAALSQNSCKMGINDLTNEGSEESTANNSDTTGLRYLALGDSHTIGEGVTQPERWPVIFQKELAARQVPVRNPEIIATTGWTTGNLLSSLSQSSPSGSFDLVSLQIGVNNQFQGRSIETYRAEFNQLLQKSIAFAAGKRSRVFVLSIPDWGASQYGASFDRNKITKEINEFNTVAMAECEKEKILFINITDTSRRALNDASMLARDGLHFSGKMHQLWVNEALPRVKDML